MNKKISTENGIYISGCSSHKFILDVDVWIDEKMDVKNMLGTVHRLMAQLCTIKNFCRTT